MEGPEKKYQMNNSVIIEKFYKAFQEGDPEKMQSHYDDEVRFTDPAFGRLKEKEVGAMWAMLLSKKESELSIEYGKVSADESSGRAEWTATYKYGPEKRLVVNKIKSQFEFRDGKIIEQTDSFDLWNWSRQALGPLGYILGWTPFFQNKIRRMARKSLFSYMKKSTE